MRLFCVWALAGPLSALVLGPQPHDEPVVELRARAEVDADVIQVGDVCDVICSDDDVRARIRHVEIAPLPVAGQSHRVTAGWVKLALRRANVDVKPILFRGAEAVEVTRASHWPRGSRGPEGRAGRDDGFPAPALCRGAAVTVAAEAGPVRVTAVGEALDDAGPGDLVRVRVVSTHAVVRGTVLDDLTVMLSCGGDAH